MSCSVCAGYSDYNCPCCGEGVRMKTCPDCHGSGYTPYMAFDVKYRRFVHVTEQAYNILPIDEDAAHDMGMRYCKVEIEVCPTCQGEGEIPIDY